MQVKLLNKVEKYLLKQERSDPREAYKVRLFLADLQNAKTPCALPNAKKLQGAYKNKGNMWRWRISNYRIIGDV